eukprot:4476603-Pyramimonas_sp.AAC.1
MDYGARSEADRGIHAGGTRTLEPAEEERLPWPLPTATHQTTMTLTTMARSSRRLNNLSLRAERLTMVRRTVSTRRQA